MCYVWSTEKFNDKLLSIRDMVSTYYDCNEIPVTPSFQYFYLGI